MEQKVLFYQFVRNTDFWRVKRKERTRRYEMYEENREERYKRDEVIKGIKEKVRHFKELEIYNYNN